MKHLGEDAGIKRAKGISKHIVKSTSHQSYRDAYHNQTESSIKMTLIRSQLRTVNTVSFQKRALSVGRYALLARCQFFSLHGLYLSGLPPKRRRVLPTPVSGDV